MEILRLSRTFFTILTQNTLPSLSTAFETKHEKLPDHAKRFLTYTHFQVQLPLLQTRQNSSQIRTSWRKKPTAAACHSKAAAFDAELLKSTPTKRTSFARDQNPDVHNHIMCIARPERMARDAPHTHQLQVFTRRDSDYHRALNLLGGQL